MIVIGFLNPSRDLNPRIIGLPNLPNEGELYDVLSNGLLEAARLARGNNRKNPNILITVDMSMPNGQRLKIPNIYAVILSENTDENRLVIPSLPS